MKTADLISALAAEPPPPPLRLGRRVALALVVGAAISAALFMTALGPRHDFAAAAHTMRFDLKFVDTLALLLPSVLLAARLAQAEARPGALIAALIRALRPARRRGDRRTRRDPADLWMTRLVGTNALHCLTLIPLMSIPPLAALIAAMRAGAPSHPALTGALAGAAAAGAAATIYATNCTDDSPLFVASWYPLATLIVVAAGALAGRKWLQW